MNKSAGDAQGAVAEFVLGKAFHKAVDAIEPLESLLDFNII
jgi:hypothetical protein